MMPYILILVILTLLWLGAFWRIKRKQNINLLAGFLFFMFLSTFASFLVMLGINYSNRLVYLLVGVIFLFALFVLLFGVYILIAFLLINSVIILRKERFSLSHILTLLVAVGIILLITLSSFLGRINPPLPIMALWSGLIVMILFLTFHIFLFIETLILTNLFHPRKNLNYIIVLGSGLINGNVSPLLAKRIHAALKVAKKQEKKKGFAPYLLMSGGQGSDETRAEALAMKEYAIEQGYSEELIITEEKSKNTLENMQFSKAVMEEKSHGENYKCAYASSSYHLMRAGIYARQVGLIMSGLGGKTAFYYLANAVLREYIAYLAMNKKLYLVVLGSIFMFGTLMYILFSALIG